MAHWRRAAGRFEVCAITQPDREVIRDSLAKLAMN